MGDPKFSRRKYVTPSHPWQKERIEAENELIRKFGLKNKTELWKVQSLLRTFRKRARDLQAKMRYGDKQAETEMEELLKRLDKIGLLSDEATLDDVLTLDTESLLGRRLQTMTYIKGLSNSQKQARQFIVHGHISVGDRRVTVPGYLVKREEEDLIDYLSKSPLADELHPARPKEEGEGREGAPPGEETSDGTAGPPEKAPKEETPKDAGEPKDETPPAEQEKKEKPADEGPKDAEKGAGPEKAEKPSEPKDEKEPKADEKAPEPEKQKADDSKEKKEEPPSSDKTKEEPPQSEKTKEER